MVIAVAAVVVAAALGLGAFGALRVASGGARLAADLAALSAGRALLDSIPLAPPAAADEAGEEARAGANGAGDGSTL